MPETKEAPEQLTPEQIENWRQALVSMFGVYALIMPVEQIQRMRDKMQEWCDDEATKEK